ncbi:hypothetical protein E3N88_38812 [Mikania micrantha]|uniref:Uncharacterized protein n=1 Tax=Mikania micrantha TaxID=192012 RepID=A0A5N6LVW3_9ASTR|nr:hypothetical protein E3N88_38812 [Mikania micrantha]
MRRGRCDSSEVKKAKNWESCGSDNWSRAWVLESANSFTLSPRTREVCCVDDWRPSCDSDTSIYEAVLHCKKTIGGKIP